MAMPETTEKITINLSVVDLGKIDFLVEQGFYANRTDFVKDAVRRTLDTHETEVREKVARTSAATGIVFLDRRDLEAARRKGQQLDLSIIGLLSFAADVTPDLADETIRSLRVYGSLRASPEVKEVLKRKMPPQVD